MYPGDNQQLIRQERMGGELNAALATTFLTETTFPASAGTGAFKTVEGRVTMSSRTPSEGQYFSRETQWFSSSS